MTSMICGDFIINDARVVMSLWDANRVTASKMDAIARRLSFRDADLLFTGKRYIIPHHDQELSVQGDTEAL